MIGTTVAMAAMAVLFVVFGVFNLAAGRRCGGDCSGCVHDCEFDSEGSVP